MPAEFAGGADGFVTYPFEVTYMEDLGAEMLVYGNIRDRAHTGHVVSRLPGNVSVQLETGRTYTFAASRRDLRFFDRATGLRKDGSLP